MLLEGSRFAQARLVFINSEGGESKGRDILLRSDDTEDKDAKTEASSDQCD